MVSILPRLATGIEAVKALIGKIHVSILPRLATGILAGVISIMTSGFYSSPSCDGDRSSGDKLTSSLVSILPRLATGIESNILDPSVLMFLFFPVLRRGSIRDLQLRE